jgi:ribosome biogenesis protein ENP2
LNGLREKKFAMTLPVTIQNKTKIYNVSGYDGGKLPEWLIQKHRKKLKKDTEYGRRIELIQEFEFPEASNIIQLTRNEKFIVSTGVYKPQIRVFDLDELSIKFERHTDSESIAMTLLEDDWTKLLLLQSNKSLELHTQGGIHYNAAIPMVRL